jgi:leucyl aminopeptidase (aminopeptidase T)
VDFEALNAIGDAMLQRVRGAVRAHITSPAGTDLWLTISGREFDTDVRIDPGTLGNLPNGELWVAPIETEAQGTLVCDGSIGDLGPVTKPITIEVVAGRITSIRGEDEELVERVRELTSVDEQGAVVGEMGFGINPSARTVGIMLEDEKVAGTAHVAFGNNMDMPGGQNSSSTHREFLMRDASLALEFEDGRTLDILRDGHLMD